MSKIDASESNERLIIRESREHLTGIWTLVWEVFDRDTDKVYGHFTTLEGARAYKEILDNDRFINSSEAEDVPEVYGVLQGNSSEGSDKS